MPHQFSQDKKIRVVLLVLLLLANVAVATFLSLRAPRAQADEMIATITPKEGSERIARCKAPEGVHQDETECIFGEIEKELKLHGLANAYVLFGAAYKDFPLTFTGQGCHKHGHRMGDIVYFNYYIKGNKDLSKYIYPQEATACGYGFFHGFFEHLMQGNPREDFITPTCEFYREALTSRMDSIATICYHGSGHGLTLAQADRLPKEKWGDLHSFTDIPLSVCDSLTRARSDEVEDCRSGVFNIMVNYMDEKNYEFSYPSKDPLAICKTYDQKYWRPCVGEFAQRFDRESGLDPVKLHKISQAAPTENLKRVAFSYGISAITQQRVYKGDGYTETLDRCGKLADDYFKECVNSLVSGLYEHGAVQEEYKKPLAMCLDAKIVSRGLEEDCYEAVALRLPRFYEKAKRPAICAEFPTKYQSICAGK